MGAKTIYTNSDMLRAWAGGLIIGALLLTIVVWGIRYVTSTEFKPVQKSEKPECELEWDAGRARFFVWCNRQIVGVGNTKEEALAQYEKFKQRTPSYREKINPTND